MCAIFHWLQLPVVVFGPKAILLTCDPWEQDQIYFEKQIKSALSLVISKMLNMFLAEQKILIHYDDLVLIVYALGMVWYCGIKSSHF